MTVQNIAGRYYAMQRDPLGGGYIASGDTFTSAINNLMATMKRHHAL